MSRSELHRFARVLGVPRRGFQGDHYDLPEVVRDVAVELGAVPVASRELLARLRSAGLRLSPAERRERAWARAEHRLDPPAWLGRAVAVVIDRPLGSPHAVGEDRYPLNVGVVPGTTSVHGEPVSAYVLGPDEPVAATEAVVVGVVRRHDDLEDQLVTATHGRWSAARIAEAVHFGEHWFRSEVLTS